MTLTPEQPPFARGPHPANLARTFIADAVRLVSLDALNFAMAHNSVPLVRELALTNPTSEAWSKLVVSVHLQGFAEPWTGNVDVIEAGATYHFSYPLRFPPAPRAPPPDGVTSRLIFQTQGRGPAPKRGIEPLEENAAASAQAP